MLRSLVGSEMCIRDRVRVAAADALMDVGMSGTPAVLRKLRDRVECEGDPAVEAAMNLTIQNLQRWLSVQESAHKMQPSVGLSPVFLEADNSSDEEGVFKGMEQYLEICSSPMPPPTPGSVPPFRETQEPYL
eukprot:TRINITY_DN31123_c0_g2_i1.p1 TRINITY_DN31123_c0_g2~~TRINITY_DN31123_c0_g2_i1.p1  ORF type:complete len:132 (+),score=26.22 TRINITY_DN31123_c0_g2_i1:121-516(+)